MMEPQITRFDDEEAALMPKPTQPVAKLKEGTVLDHLRAGAGLRCLRVLNLPKGTTVTIGMNLTSKRLERKDIIKIENRELTRDEINRIALMSPDASISIIRNYRVVEKFRVEVPEVIEGSMRCRNPNCITNLQAVRSRFTVCRRNPTTVRCGYCERRAKQGEFDFII